MGGIIAQWLAYLRPDPAAPGSIPRLGLAEVNQQQWLDESGQCLENVDRTHLALASGKPVLQKAGIFFTFCCLIFKFLKLTFKYFFEPS